MAKVSFAHKPKLRAYIESRGRRLPISVSKYIRPGDKDTMCVFCNSLLDGVEHEVQLYHDGIEGAEATGAYMCGICFVPVKEMEAKLAGETGLGSLFDTYGLGDRLELFAKELVFQTDVHRHYQHLDTLFEVRPEEAEMCYFCKNQSRHDYFRLKVPVSGAEYVDGGEVRCCFSCRDLLLDVLVEKNISKFYENKGITPVECYTCEKEYLIYGGELEYRLQSNLLAMHNCPECTLQTLANWQTLDSPALEYIYTPLIDEFLVKRWRVAYCAYCESPMDLDITLPTHITLANNVSWKGLIMCPECAYGRSGPLSAFVYNGKVWAVYDTAEETTFRVLVRTLSGRRLLEKTVKGDIIEIILNSYNTITKYMDPIQLDLKM